MTLLLQSTDNLDDYELPAASQRITESAIAKVLVDPSHTIAKNNKFSFPMCVGKVPLPDAQTTVNLNPFTIIIHITGNPNKMNDM